MVEKKGPLSSLLPAVTWLVPGFSGSDYSNHAYFGFDWKRLLVSEQRFSRRGLIRVAQAIIGVSAVLDDAGERRPWIRNEVPDQVRQRGDHAE